MVELKECPWTGVVVGVGAPAADCVEGMMTWIPGVRCAGAVDEEGTAVYVCEVEAER